MKLHSIESFGNAPARSGEIRVERIEKRLCPKVPFPHRHDFYHLLFLEKGTGWHEIDFTKFKVRPGQMYFVKPGEVHSWKLSASTCGFVLEFTRESIGKSAVVDELFQYLENAPAMLEGKNAAPLKPLFQLMHEEFKEARGGFRLCLENLLGAFVIRVARHQNKENKGSSLPTLVSQFQQLIEKHFQKQHAVEFYAQELKISGKTLTTKISRALGKSAGAVIQERCLVEAKRLLAYSDLSIADVGYQIGFEDPNYFARFFRQKTGHSAGEFRKRAIRSISV